MNKAHAAHVRRQLIDLFEPTVIQAERPLAVPGVAEVEDAEIVGGGPAELVFLDVHTPHPIPLALQLFDQVTADKAPGATDECLLHDCHQTGC
jgi:hypothetical protein